MNVQTLPAESVSDKELELIQDDYISPVPEALHWDEWAADDEGMTGDKLLGFVDQTLFPTLANINQEGILNQMPEVVQFFIITQKHLPISFGWNDNTYPVCLAVHHNCIGIICLVC